MSALRLKNPRLIRPIHECPCLIVLTPSAHYSEIFYPNDCAADSGDICVHICKCMICNKRTSWEESEYVEISVSHSQDNVRHELVGKEETTNVETGCHSPNIVRLRLPESIHPHIIDPKFRLGV